MQYGTENYNTAELERMAYARGDYGAAELYGRLDDAECAVDELLEQEREFSEECLRAADNLRTVASDSAAKVSNALALLDGALAIPRLPKAAQDLVEDAAKLLQAAADELRAEGG